MFPARCAGIEHFLLKVIGNLSDIDLVINTRDYPQTSEHFGKLLPIFSFSKVCNSFVIDSKTFVLREKIFIQLHIVFDVCLVKVEQFVKYVFYCVYVYFTVVHRHHSIMILCIQHGHFGKAVQLSRCIPVALADGISIVNL